MSEGRVSRINRILTEMYGAELMNAKRVIATKLVKSKPNPDNLTLAERILINRKLGNPPAPQPLESVARSVNIPGPTNKNNDLQTPSPEPATKTNNQQSPLKRQDTKKTINIIASEQPGPSNRNSATPPLPPIKTASPKPESKTRTPTPQNRIDALQNNVPASRRETPLLPPIERKDLRAVHSKARMTAVDEIQPPKDMRQFDPDIGVGVDDEEISDMQTSLHPIESEEAQDRLNVDEQKANITILQTDIEKIKQPTPEPKHKSPERENPKTPSPQKVTAAPVVAAVVTSSRNTRSRTRSRSRSRKNSKSQSRSKSRERKKPRSRSSSHSGSTSKRRSRRSRSRKRYKSNSYSTSSSPSRHRRYSFSPVSKRKSRARSKSRRRSFDYDFDRAKSIVRSLSRIRSFSRMKQRSPSIEYAYVGGNNGFWPQIQNQSPKRKKKIIIVQGGGMLPQQTKRRNQSSSDSDISVVIANKKSKSRGRKGKISDSDDETDENNTRSREKKAKKKRGKGKKAKKKESNSDNDSDTETDKNIKASKKPSKHKNLETAKKNIRFDLKNEKRNDKKKQKEVEESENEAENDENRLTQIEKSVKPKKQKSDADSKNETLSDVPLSTDPPVKTKSPPLNNTRMPFPFSPQSKKLSAATLRKTAPKTNDDQLLMKALEQLDKRNDFELEQLKGGNLRKLPPDVNLDLKKKIFSKEFQENINAFLES